MLFLASLSQDEMFSFIYETELVAWAATSSTGLEYSSIYLVSTGEASLLVLSLSLPSLPKRPISKHNQINNKCFREMKNQKGAKSSQLCIGVRMDYLIHINAGKSILTSTLSYRT